jgi:hypothetical protein
VAGGALVLIDKNSTLRKYREIAFTAKSIASRPIKAPIARLPARTSSLQAFCLRLAGLILLLLTVWLAGLNTSSLKPASQLSSLAGLLPSVRETSTPTPTSFFIHTEGLSASGAKDQGRNGSAGLPAIGDTLQPQPPPHADTLGLGNNALKYPAGTTIRHATSGSGHI